MTSGQCTIGAIRKVRRWRPVSSTSPSLTSCAVKVTSKKRFIIASVLALHTTVASGYRSSSSVSVAEWSGSMCCTTT